MQHASNRLRPPVLYPKRAWMNGRCQASKMALLERVIKICSKMVCDLCTLAKCCGRIF